MAFLDDMKKKMGVIGEKLSISGKKAVDKTKVLAEIAKLTLSVSEEEKKIAEMYAKIGREYVKCFSGSEDCICTDVISEISNSEQKVCSLNERIKNLKGKKLCPSCKEYYDMNSKFCPECGVGNTSKDDGPTAKLISIDSSDDSKE